MKKSTIIILIIAAIVLIGWGVTRSSGKLGAMTISLTSTNSSSTIGSTVAVQIFSDSTSATYRACTNTGLLPVYLSYNATSTGFTALTGRVLTVSSTIEMNEPNGTLWPGSVWAKTANGTSTVSCLQI